MMTTHRVANRVMTQILVSLPAKHEAAKPEIQVKRQSNIVSRKKGGNEKDL